MNEIGRRAKVASRQLARAKTDQKNQTLLMLADRLIAQRELILRENVKDVEAATDTGLVPALIDRLALDDSRLNGVAADVRRVASLPDPVG